MKKIINYHFLSVFRRLACLRWYLIVVLIRISLMIRDIEHFSRVYWPFGCLLWKNVYVVSLLIFNQIVAFFLLFVVVNWIVWVRYIFWILTPICVYCCVCVCVWSHSVMSDSLRPTRLLCPWDFPGKSTGVDCHFLLQGIFPRQGSNPGLPHCRQTLYRLSYQ